MYYSAKKQTTKKNTCLLCTKSFTLQRQLKLHYHVKHSIQHVDICRICGCTFTCTKELSRHMLRFHGPQLVVANMIEK